VRAGDQCAHEQSSLYRLIAGAQLTLRLGVAAGAALERGGGRLLEAVVAALLRGEGG